MSQIHVPTSMLMLCCPAQCYRLWCLLQSVMYLYWLPQGLPKECVVWRCPESTTGLPASLAVAHTLYPANVLMLSQQKQCPDLQEKPMISHLMALSSSQLQEGKCCKNFLSKVTHLGFLPSGNLEVETCSSDHTSSTPPPHGSLGSRE